MNIQITVSESDYDLILNCIHSSYMSYHGNELDQDVYEFNTILDNLISNINKSKERVEQ